MVGRRLEALRSAQLPRFLPELGLAASTGLHLISAPLPLAQARRCLHVLALELLRLSK